MSTAPNNQTTADPWPENRARLEAAFEGAAMLDTPITKRRPPEPIVAGTIALVRGRPNYRAVVERDDWGRVMVRPLPEQGMSTRARCVWRKSVLALQA